MAVRRSNRLNGRTRLARVMFYIQKQRVKKKGERSVDDDDDDDIDVYVICTRANFQRRRRQRVSRGKQRGECLLILDSADRIYRILCYPLR